MSVTQDDVIEILRIMDESRFQELHLEMGDLKIVLNKDGGRSPVWKGDVASGGVPESVGDARPEIEISSTPPPLDQHKKVTSPIGEEIIEDGLVPINSPMLGTFYIAPKPDEPPFVEVGSAVTEATTVCIIEVMKLFSTINAGVRGKIVKVCAEDGQLVEHGQVLFVIKPDNE